MSGPEKPWMVVTSGASHEPAKASGSQSRWLCTMSKSPERSSACPMCMASHTRPSIDGSLA